MPRHAPAVTGEGALNQVTGSKRVPTSRFGTCSHDQMVLDMGPLLRGREELATKRFERLDLNHNIHVLAS